jgi:hypothetical protein
VDDDSTKMSCETEIRNMVDGGESNAQVCVVGERVNCKNVGSLCASISRCQERIGEGWRRGNTFSKMWVRVGNLARFYYFLEIGGEGGKPISAG